MTATRRQCPRCWTLSARMPRSRSTPSLGIFVLVHPAHLWPRPLFTALAQCVQPATRPAMASWPPPGAGRVRGSLHFLVRSKSSSSCGVVLLAAITSYFDWHTAATYFNGTVNYTSRCS